METNLSRVAMLAVSSVLHDPQTATTPVVW